ncbi:MAG: FAD-dependent oxidoreductase [Pseudomonadota bacterium]|nr:FAD-dependent oxidoreductase [Pseudomonadota bacterium]
MPKINLFAKDSIKSDVIVVGAGIAGLAAALEASNKGASVIVIESSSVAGGHAVKAGGLAMTDTALQRSKGIKDSPDLAYNDLLRWGETPNKFWAKRYAEESGPEVYDWLVELGVEFAMLIPTPDHSVPRFHFTRGRSVNVVLPMLRNAALNPNIKFVWNTRVKALLRARGKINGVVGENQRTGEDKWYEADSVVLSTGGFENNLLQVRKNWPSNQKLPNKLLIGAGAFANGDGYRLAEWAGADMQNMDRQVIFYNGLPDPRDETNTRALKALNTAAIWVNESGRRFVNESGDEKSIEAAVSNQKPVSYWVIYDSKGAKGWQVRDALWLKNSMLDEVLINNKKLTVAAENISELAVKAGLNKHGLTTTIQTWNRMVELGSDFQFNRFSKETKGQRIYPIKEAPFYATQLYPYTRKSMGGPAINELAQVIDNEGIPIDGLYAAGELTGVGGINGEFGGSGTFLGPSVLTGRIAGASGAENSNRSGKFIQPNQKIKNVTTAILGSGQGFWHFEESHAQVSEMGWNCTKCHNALNPKRTPRKPEEMLERLNTCKECH